VLEYELVRDIDKAIIFSEVKHFALGQREAKEFEKNIELNTDLITGKYYLNVNIKSPTQYPLSGFVHDINIVSSSVEAVYLMKGPYFKFPIDNNGTLVLIESYGTTGSNIDMNADFDLIFNLQSDLTDNSNLIAVVDVYPSYSDVIDSSFEYDLYDVNKNIEKIFSFPMNYNKSGTYNVVLSIYSGTELLVSKDVRMVISGISGSIVRVSNIKDVYYPNEEVIIEADLVGPADGANILKDAKLDLFLSQYGEQLFYFSNSLDDLDFDVITSRFAFGTQDLLDAYLVRIVLRDDSGFIYDEVELSYEELALEKVISEDGRIYDPNVDACFDDNVCNNIEYSLGDCSDCYLKEFDEVVFVEIDRNKVAFLESLKSNEIELSDDSLFDKILNYKYFIFIVINSIILLALVIIFWRYHKK
jgi:hypothetical protein